MELFQELFIQALPEKLVKVNLPQIEIDVEKIVNLKSYQGLGEIKAILEDDSLEYCQCFMHIDRIIDLFNSFGDHIVGRHDFC